MDRIETMWHLPEALREIEEAGDVTIVLELIDSFQNDTAARFERLHAAVARLDAAMVKAEAHAMQGSARQMGAEALADLCQAVEASAAQRNWLELEGQVEQADLRFAEVRNAMAEYVRARRRPS
jgi:HPt (histidine-containing phosphotransfer) domain-containing protein